MNMASRVDLAMKETRVERREREGEKRDRVRERSK